MDNYDKDLLIPLSPDAQAAVDAGIIPIEAFSVREIVSDIKPETLDKYGDSLLYQAYSVALRCNTSSRTVLAKNLGISTQLYDYYCEKYPKFKAVIKLGLLDAKEQMKETVVSSLYKAAQGYTAREVVTVVQHEYDEEGSIRGTVEKTSTAEKYIPANVNAALELMKRLDPSWVPQVKVDVSGNIDHIHASVEDISVAVDFRKLSPSAIRELLSANRQSVNLESNAVEEKTGSDVVETPIIEQPVVNDSPPKKRRGRPKGTTKAVMEARKFNREAEKAHEQAKKSAEKSIKNISKESKNGKD